MGEEEFETMGDEFEGMVEAALDGFFHRTWDQREERAMTRALTAAHARTDIPALTAELRRLRATNKRLRAENKRLQTAIDTSCDDYLHLPRSSRDEAF